MGIQRAVYVGSDPKYACAIFKSAIWDFFDVIKGTVKLQFDDVALGTLAYNWYEFPLCDVVIEFGGQDDSD